jgi:hypothetical protein
MHAVADPAGLLERLTSVPGMPALLLYLAAAAVPLAVLHELGHAVVAWRRLGVSIQASVGGTGTFLSIRIGRLTLTVNALTHPDETPDPASLAAARASARDLALVALGGPVSSLLGSVIAVCALAVAPKSGGVHDVLWALTVMGLLGALSIVPLVFQERPGGPRLRTDGRLALEAAHVARRLRGASSPSLTSPEPASATPATARTRAIAMGRGADTRAPHRSRERRTGAPSGR